METKCSLSERDIITKYILPAIEASGWDKRNQIREEVSFTAGRIFVKGKLTKRGEKKRADIIIYYKSNIPVAVVEANPKLVLPKVLGVVFVKLELSVIIVAVIWL